MRALILAGTGTLADMPAVLNIGSGRPIRVRDLIETIATVIGDGALARVDFGAVPLRPNDLPDMFADTTAARRLLGYAPAVALEGGLSRTIAWHRTARVGAAR